MIHDTDSDQVWVKLGRSLRLKCHSGLKLLPRIWLSEFIILVIMKLQINVFGGEQILQ